MRTNIDIDDQLMNEALRVTQTRTKKEVVHLALKELVRIKNQALLLDLKGKINWEGDLDTMRDDRL